MNKYWNWLYSLAIAMYLTAIFSNRWWFIIGSGLYVIAGSIVVCFGKD